MLESAGQLQVLRAIVYADDSASASLLKTSPPIVSQIPLSQMQYMPGTST